jgi:hypothetical protein
MMEPSVKGFVFGAVVGGLLVALLLLSLRNVGNPQNSNYTAVENAAKGIRCPDGAVLVYAPWGESGWMAKCQLAHGPFVAAEHGRIAAQGEFLMGKPIEKH